MIFVFFVIYFILNWILSDSWIIDMFVGLSDLIIKYACMQNDTCVGIFISFERFTEDYLAMGISAILSFIITVIAYKDNPDADPANLYKV